MKFVKRNAGILAYKEETFITLAVSITEVVMTLIFVGDSLTYHFPLGSSEWSAYYQRQNTDGSLGERKLCGWDHCHWCENVLRRMFERTSRKIDQDTIQRALKVVQKLKEAEA